MAAARRFTVEQYLRLSELRVIEPDDRVELHEGFIVEKSARTPACDSTVNELVPRFLAILAKANGWVLRTQSCLLLDRSVPEPDLAMVRGPHQKYFEHHPRAGDVGLLIEVADSSRRKDRKLKGGWYAEARVPEFWLVNLVLGQVEVYTQPKAGKSPAYRKCKVYRKGDKVPFVLDGAEFGKLEVAELCPVKA